MLILTWDNLEAKVAGMQTLESNISTAHVPRWGRDVSQVGEKTIKNVIEIGGMNPTKKGGPRIKSGQMIGAVDSAVLPDGAGAVTALAAIGWNTAPPMHALYQEGGTSRGVTPMMAMPMASMEMGTAMDDTGMNMLRRIAVEWNAI